MTIAAKTSFLIFSNYTKLYEYSSPAASGKTKMERQ
jgi:hypothetical protein